MTDTAAARGGAIPAGPGRERATANAECAETAWATGILTLSDKGAAGGREDLSGATIREMLADGPFRETAYAVIPDDHDSIVKTLVEWSDQRGLALILTTGGTGVSPRDVTPEATQAVLHRELPGMAEAMRWVSYQKTPHAVISRAMAGTRGRCLIVNLPGSPKAVRENLEAILAAIPHALGKIHGDPTECAS